MGEAANGVAKKVMKLTNGSSHVAAENGAANGANGAATAPSKRCLWFEEELEEDLRWVFGVSKYTHFSLFHCLRLF